MLSIRQLRAARALLDLDQPELAELAGVSRPTIQRIEHPDFGPEKASERVIEAVRDALESAGVIFLTVEDGLGEGVRLKSQEDAPAVKGRTRGRGERTQSP